MQTYALGNWIPPYGIVLVADTLGGLFAFMVTTIMIGGLLYTVHSHDKCMNYPAFLPLFLLMEVGLVGAMLTGDLFTLFIFIELMALGIGIVDGAFGRSLRFGGGAEVPFHQLDGDAVLAFGNRRNVCHLGNVEHGGYRANPADG